MENFSAISTEAPWGRSGEMTIPVPHIEPSRWAKAHPIHESLPGVKQDFLFFHLLFFF
jgi:hypothetical protein